MRQHSTLSRRNEAPPSYIMHIVARLPATRTEGAYRTPCLDCATGPIRHTTPTLTPRSSSPVNITGYIRLIKDCYSCSDLVLFSCSEPWTKWTDYKKKKIRHRFVVGIVGQITKITRAILSVKTTSIHVDNTFLDALVMLHEIQNPLVTEDESQFSSSSSAPRVAR